jgi:hypothetical protein
VKLGAVVGAVAACAGCKATVKANDFEAELSQRVTTMGMHASKITCPGDVEAKAGQVFTCQLALDAPADAKKQARTYALDVTIKALDLDKKKFDFDTAWHDGPAVQTVKIEGVLGAELTKELGGALTLRCGDEPLAFLDSAHKLHCALAAGDVQTKATFDFDAKSLEPNGWHLDPPLLAKAKIEAVLTPAVREKVPGVTIDCGPAAFLIRPADGVLTCKATSGAETGTLKVDIDDSLNVKRWELGS